MTAAKKTSPNRRNGDLAMIHIAAKRLFGDVSMVLMSQRMDAMRQRIGQRLLPVVMRLTPVIDAFMDRAFAWIDANPELITGIGAVVVGIGALAAVMAPVLIASATLISSWAVMSYGATRLALTLGGLSKWSGKAGKVLFWMGRTVLPLVGKAIMLIGRALIANPIGVAVMAIAGAAYLIYQYWEPISGFFSNLWGRVRGELVTAWETIKTLFLNYHPLGLIYTHWDGVTEWFGSLWSRVKAKFTEGWEAIKAEVATWPGKMKDYGGQLIQRLIDGIKAKLGALGNVVKEAMAQLNPFSNVPVTVNLAEATRATVGAGTASGLSASRQAQVRAKHAEWLRSRGVPEHVINGASAADEPAAQVPDMGSAATAGATGARNTSVNFAPSYNMPVNIETTGDPEALRGELRAYLDEVKEQSQADARSLLHDE